MVVLLNLAEVHDAGVLASLGAVGFPPAVLAQFAGVAATGGLIGTIIGRRVTATELPQMVAMLHSVVGLAAVLTSIGSILSDPSHASMLHLVTGYVWIQFMHAPWQSAHVSTSWVSLSVA